MTLKKYQDSGNSSRDDIGDDNDYFISKFHYNHDSYED